MRITCWAIAVLCCCLLFAGCDGGGGPVSVTKTYTIAAITDTDFVFSSAVDPERWYREFTVQDYTTFGDREYQWRNKFRTYLRWVVDIPAGSTVTSAVMTFNAYSTDESTLSFTPTINLIDQDDCLAPADQLPFVPPGVPSRIADNGTTLPSYSGSPVSWPITTAWIDGTDYSSIDISTLVQSYIDRPGYASGQHIGLMIEEGNAADGDVRLAYVTAGTTPVLMVTYTPRPHYAARMLERTPARQFVDATTARRFAERTPGRQFADATTKHRFVDATVKHRFREGSEG